VASQQTKNYSLSLLVNFKRLNCLFLLTVVYESTYDTLKPEFLEELIVLQPPCSDSLAVNWWLQHDLSSK
jgi:hypothetical protein